MQKILKVFVFIIYFIVGLFLLLVILMFFGNVKNLMSFFAN